MKRNRQRTNIHDEVGCINIKEKSYFKLKEIIYWMRSATLQLHYSQIQNYEEMKQRMENNIILSKRKANESISNWVFVDSKAQHSDRRRRILMQNSKPSIYDPFLVKCHSLEQFVWHDWMIFETDDDDSFIFNDGRQSPKK
jgi:hypothetical protein